MSNLKHNETENTKRRKPKKSVMKPGIINKKAAKAIEAPEISSYIGVLF